MSDIDDCRKSVERLTRDRGEVMSAGNDKIAEIRDRVEQDVAKGPANKEIYRVHKDRSFLLAEVDRQRAENERLRAKVAWLEKHSDEIEAKLEELRWP